MKEKLQDILQKAEAEIKQAETFYDLSNIKARFIGRKSNINDLMKYLSTLTP